MTRQMEILQDDFGRALAVVAHPDDLEYGAASAIARWTRRGISVGYVIVTDGEAGIDGLDPADAGPLRQKEQVASAGIVGVDDVTFLGHRDGVVENGLSLRRDIARQIRRYRPEVLVTATYEPTYRMGGRQTVNQADHRAVGIAVLDAARDAGNRWIFPELLDDGYEPWTGVRHVYVMGASPPTHAVDVTDHLDAGIASLQAHEAYLRGLGRDFDPDEFVRGITAMAGPAISARHAVAFGQIHLQGV
ncbi:PIG-L deacetylase family protein [Pseudonocardia sp. WMMC193]|uniref:PIG-L deacetylase family protein n=1 Tax=Pseudonocardia sp. WMMC193 TaxID=2911965 RepID=UPI001F39E071|nr:PIG-L deacetylase family protein [Pseudonocardia sp. WMMC193]MCF7547459.1 PIG-L family deacetylase [Pseudonocardia sp. WMMC193]